MPKSLHQVAALPYRVGPNGLEVLLVTSRNSERWIVPKGWPMRGRSSEEAAAREAYEEAGVSGEIASEPIGAFSYAKRRKSGSRTCLVAVYALRVRRQSGNWPERGQRDLKWIPAIDAVEAVTDSGLGDLIRHFAGAVGACR